MHGGPDRVVEGAANLLRQFHAVGQASPLVEGQGASVAIRNQPEELPLQRHLDNVLMLAGQVLQDMANRGSEDAHHATAAGVGEISPNDAIIGQSPCSPPQQSLAFGASLKITVHGVEGSMGVSTLAHPFVRLHIVDQRTGLWCSREIRPATRHAVYNLTEFGQPYLRTTHLRSEPWHMESRRAYEQIPPFSTAPYRLLQRQAALGPSAKQGCEDAIVCPAVAPFWHESFVVPEPPSSAVVLLLELLDAVPDVTASIDTAEGGGNSGLKLRPLGWAFLDLDSDAAAPRARRHQNRRLQLQLHQYRFAPRGGFGTEGLDILVEHNQAGPEVFTEYLNLKRRSNARDEGASLAFRVRNWWSRPAHSEAINLPTRSLRESLIGRSQATVPAVLEISLAKASLPLLHALALLGYSESGDKVEHCNPQPRHPSVSNQSVKCNTPPQSPRLDASFTSAGEDSCSEAADPPLASHHFRYGDEPYLLPDGLAWHFDSGDRGAVRLSISPSGQLLAAAIGHRGGCFELRVFSLTLGKLHALCSPAHDSMIYDICWHSFGRNQSGHCGGSSSVFGEGQYAPPLLISCGGDALVQIFEVPDDPRRLPGGKSGAVLRPHARIQLTSHCYSVRLHSALSENPQQIVLACGGHNFGVTICRFLRVWEPQQDLVPKPGRGVGGAWVARAPAWQEVVNYKPAAAGPPGRSEFLSLGARRLSGAQWQPPVATAASVADVPPPDILCVRFSEQRSTPDNLYASDSIGHIVLFQVRFDSSADAGRGAIRASFVRTYATSYLGGAIYNIEVVTQKLLDGKRLNHVQLSTVDDWLLLNTRSHAIQIVCLQRGACRVELEMTGLESGIFPLRASMSPDGAFVACGSESGRLLGWSAIDGKALLPAALPNVCLAGAVMDVVWSPKHHMLVCCALDDQAPPILVFVGGHPDRPFPVPSGGKEDEKKRGDQGLARACPLPLVFVPLRDRQGVTAAVVATSAQNISEHGWTDRWLESTSENPRSAISFDEKKAMKVNILAQLLERRKMENVLGSFATGIPGGV